AVGARRASGPWHHALLAAALWGAGLGALVGLVLAFQAAHVAVLRTVWNSGLVGAIEAVLAAGLVLLVRFSVGYLRWRAGLVGVRCLLSRDSSSSTSLAVAASV